MKRILITSHSFLPNIGGVENSLKYLAQSWAEQGYGVDIVVSDVGYEGQPDEVLGAAHQSIHVHRYSCWPHIPWWLGPVRFLLTLFSQCGLLHKVTRHSKPELVLSRHHDTTLAAKLVGLKRVVYLLPGVVLHQNRGKNLSRKNTLGRVAQHLRLMRHHLAQWGAVRAADELAVFSNNMKMQLCGTLGVDAASVHNVNPGVDTARFAPIPSAQRLVQCAELGLHPERKTLLIVGRFVRAKGIQFALDALTQLDDCQLVLVGDGEERAEYEQFVATHGLGERVVFTGNRHDAERYYQCADLFLMLSSYEPFGQTILEASASRVPVIAFEPDAHCKTAAKEILGSHAIFVPERSVGVLVDTIRYILAAPARLERFGSASQQLVMRNYKWSHLAHALHQIGSNVR